MTDPIRKKKNEEDRRKHSRRALFTDVNYKVMMPSGDRGKTQNISEGGICLVLNRELPTGTILELKFEQPGKDSRLIKALAKVVWQKKTDKGFLTGVNFQK